MTNGRGEGPRLVFCRREEKYKLNEGQYAAFMAAAGPFLEDEGYGLCRVANLYFDTEDFWLARTSIEKPDYKEKLRLRTYGQGEAGPAFLELKKKSGHTVYKRRLVLDAARARRFLADGTLPERDEQILKEIRYVLWYYRPVPKAYLAYDRQAFIGRRDPELRITFDQNLRRRWDTLSFTDAGSLPVFPTGQARIYLMEIKAPGALPLWLAHLLAELGLYPTSFSKYGSVYKMDMAQNVAERAGRAAALAGRTGEGAELCLQV